MTDMPFSLDFSKNISSNTLENLVFEAEEISNLDFFNRAAIPADVLGEIEDRRKKDEKESFVISSHHPIFGAKRIHIMYIHDKSSYVKGLTEALQKIEWSVAFYTGKKENISDIMDALVLGSYRFEAFLSKKKEKKMTIVCSEFDEGSQAMAEERKSLLAAIYLTRDLVNTPPSLKFPRKLASEIQKLPFKNTKVSILDKKELEKKGFGCLLGVASGSDQDPYVVVFERMVDKNLPTYALAGKGVTFDAGWLQIKPDHAMLDMKSDMAWAAAVVGTMLYLDKRVDLNANIVATIGLTENLLGGSAMKPLDILRSYNGKTVEIGHTDAEWRLVLADLFGYLEANYAPKGLISVATLTGAQIYALGYNYAAAIGNDKELVHSVIDSASGEEKFWQLPLDADMIEKARGEISDVKNVTDGYKAGSSMGAAFLFHFLEKTPFVHLDIAGPAYRTAPYSYFPKGATGFGVMTLANFFLKK